MVDEEQSGSVPWWLWPNVLNLDAPVVAVVWQEAFARFAGVELAAPHRWLLFLAVWQVYFADRCLDARIGAHEATERHRFHRNIGPVGWAVMAVVCVAGLALAFRCLTREGWIGAGVLLSATGCWFAAAHIDGARRGWIPKELGVGSIFAAGCALQPWALAGSAGAPLWAAAGLFTVVCVQNCASITVWEALPSDRKDPRSFLNRRPFWSRHVGRISLALAVATAAAAWLGAMPELRGVGSAAAASLLILGGLGRVARGGRHREARMLADLALLTPLALLLFAG